MVTFYSVQCTVYSIQCTVYSVHHTVYWCKVNSSITLSTVQEGLVCWRQLFDLMYQVDVPGTPSQIKAAYGHSKVL